MNGNVHNSTIDLLALNTLDMNAPLPAVDLDNLASLVGIVATGNANLRQAKDVIPNERRAYSCQATTMPIQFKTMPV